MDFNFIFTILAILSSYLSLYWSVKSHNSPSIKSYMFTMPRDPVYFEHKGNSLKLKICNFGSKAAYNIEFSFLNSEKKELLLEDIIQKDVLLEKEQHDNFLDLEWKLNYLLSEKMQNQENIKECFYFYEKLNIKYKIQYEENIIEKLNNKLKIIDYEIEKIKKELISCFGTEDINEIKYIISILSRRYNEMERKISLFLESKIVLYPEQEEIFEIYADSKRSNYYDNNSDFSQIKYLSVSYEEAFRKNPIDYLLNFHSKKKKKPKKIILEIEENKEYQQTLSELVKINENKISKANNFFNNDIYLIWHKNLNYNQQNYMNKLRLKYNNNMYQYIEHFKSIEEENFKKSYLQLLKIIFQDELFLSTIREEAEIMHDEELNIRVYRLNPSTLT